MQRVLLAVSLLFVVPTLPAGAQQQDDMISKKLVALLFPGFLDRLVEGLPDDFPEDALPDGATALVSMGSLRSVTVVAEAPAFTLADRPRYERKLAASGWKEGAGPMGARGLMASPVAVPTMFCRDDRMLSYSTQPRPGGGHHVRISLSSAAQHGPCGQREPRPPRSMFDDAALPPLPPPAGARAMGLSSGGSGEALTQTVRLETALGHADVEAYYTRLLTEAGWKFEGRVTGLDLSIARFAATGVWGTPDGRQAPRDVAPRPGLLETLALPGGDVLVTLRVIGPRSERLP